MIIKYEGLSFGVFIYKIILFIQNFIDKVLKDGILLSPWK